MLELRSNLPSIAPVLMIGMTGMPGHNSAVTCLIAPRISGLSGYGEF
jgi:hypothetical protein